LLQNANTAYNTQIKQITYVTLFANFPSQQNQIPNPVAQGQIARHARNEERAGNLFYLRAVIAHSRYRFDIQIYPQDIDQIFNR
jgi:hypothetical protein